MIDAGKLRHRVLLQSCTGAVDDYGDPLYSDDDQWTTEATVWAAIDPVSGKEFYAAEQARSSVSHKIRLRYRQGVSAAWRVLYGSRVFRILSVIDWEERHESLLLMAQEIEA